MAGPNDYPGDESSLREIRLLGIQAPNDDDSEGISSMLSLMAAEFDDVPYTRPYDPVTQSCLDPVKGAEKILGERRKSVAISEIYNLKKAGTFGLMAAQGSGMLSYVSQEHAQSLVPGWEGVEPDHEGYLEETRQHSTRGLKPKKVLKSAGEISLKAASIAGTAFAIAEALRHAWG